MHFGGWLTTDDHGGGFEMAETKGVVLATIGVGPYLVQDFKQSMSGSNGIPLHCWCFKIQYIVVPMPIVQVMQGKVESRT